MASKTREHPVNLHMRTLTTWARLEAAQSGLKAASKTREHPVDLHMRTLSTWARHEAAQSGLENP